MPKKNKSLYTQLSEYSQAIAMHTSISHVLEWDQETFMPEGAIDIRSAQLANLASYIHKLKTSPKYTKLLKQLIDLETGAIADKTLTQPQMAALREWRRDYRRNAKLPSSFVKTFTNTCSKASHIWTTAKKESNFKLFSPHLEKIVKLCRKQAQLLGPQNHPYDALLDLYEPGMRVAILDPLFERLKIALTQLVHSIRAKAAVNTTFLKIEYPLEKQFNFGKTLLNAMGFHPETSRLDTSSHPFCVGVHPTDTRMTTRLHPNMPMSNIFSVLHEGGHGLYNMHRPAEHYGSPLGQQVSLGIDESQSRWWEALIGRSLPFWEHFFPMLQETFPKQLQHVTLEEFYPAINEVIPSFIRVEADEVTYGLHVIIRYEIEKRLIEGSLSVKEIPQVWNEKMQSYLGITPKNDAEGCLQDIHWSMGSFGYFPTYILGNVYSAQFFAKFAEQHPTWKERVSQGELKFIQEWLTLHIHQWGSQFTPNELIERVSGKPLTEEPYVTYLHTKYQKLYNL